LARELRRRHRDIGVRGLIEKSARRLLAPALRGAARSGLLLEVQGLRWVTIFGVSCVLTGCGTHATERGDAGAGADGSGADGLPDADPLATPSAFCSAFTTSLATAEARCYGGTVEDWQLSYARFCRLEKSNMAHSIEYARAAADACLATEASLTASACDAFADCFYDVVHGRVPDGQPCSNRLECGQGAMCSPSDVANACSTPTCWRYPALGAPCAGLCGPDAICGTAGVCVPFVGLGVGAACDDVYNRCATDLECRADPSSVVAGARVCRQIADGLPCVEDRDCPYVDFCDTICKPRLPLGASCTDHPTGCFDVGACDRTTKTCVSAGHPGEPCGLGGICFYGWCDQVFGSGCHPPSGEGGSCFSDGDCLAGKCVAGACMACP
jgi:hypothetical protein